jgi:GNAT superfamily N-acetyltransferase
MRPCENSGVVSLRAAVPEDAMAVAEVHVRSWQEGYRGLMPAEFLAALDPAEWASRYTFGAPGRPVTTVAVDDAGAILGLATVGPSPESEDASSIGQLYAIYVDPAAWGQGIGRLLLSDAREQLSASGFTEAQLWVLLGNERADRFYRADGWVPDGRRREDDVRGIRVMDVCYRTTLS